MQAGVARVVAAMRDPNPQVAGGGARARAPRASRFESGLMEDEARELNIGFVSRMTRGRPWVRMKIAATLDGSTALANGAASGSPAPRRARDGHRWRARACAVLTGIGTVKADDPRLTVREVADAAPAAARGRRQPARDAAGGAHAAGRRRVLVFARGQAAADAARRRGAWCCRIRSGKVDLPTMLAGARRGASINELHVEAGFKLNGSLLREGCVDEFLVYLAPSFLGDDAQGMLELPAFGSLDERLKLKILSLERIGEDLRILARPA